MLPEEITLSLFDYFLYRKYLSVSNMRLFSGASDMISYDLDSSLIETSIATTEEELETEFKNRRHTIYKDRFFLAKMSHTKCVPNRFYLAVPEELENTALEYIKKTNDCYGLLILPNDEGYKKAELKKSGFLIHNGEILKAEMCYALLKKLSTEVITRTRNYVKLRKQIQE